MPALPTINVTNAQASVIMDAYKNQFGTTTDADTIVAFQNWLTDQVREVVLLNESRKLDEENNKAKQQLLSAVEKALPKRAAPVEPTQLK